MDKSGSLSIEDALLNEIYLSPSVKRRNLKKSRRYPQVLESLDSHSSQARGMKNSQSASTLFDSKNGGFGANSSSLNTGTLKPLPVQDYHRVSDLMHRVTSVSGYTPDQSELSPINKPIPSSNVEISANMQEYQLKAMKDSNALRGTMEQVIQVHQELENVVRVHLLHRKEVGSVIDEINQRYIQLFELTLSEMLKTQRSKFKSQTQDIEKLKAQVQELEGQLSAAVKTAELQSEKILNLRSTLFELEANLTVAQEELTELRIHKRESDRDKQDFEYRLSNALGCAKLENENRVKKLISDHQQELSTVQLKFAHERLKLSEKQDNDHTNYEKLMKEVLVLREKAKALDSLANSVQQRRPLRDNTCQTQVTENGLWDKQDGWVLPISKTAQIRNLWRAGMRFAACRACRGIGTYVHKVGAVLRGVMRGKEVIKETVIEQDLSKWSLPDECVRFMSNLPKTVQAFRPHALGWTVRCVYHLFSLKYAVDREDDALGYLRQPFVDFVIERYLMSTDSRADAELRMFRLIRSVREYYPRHGGLQLFARFIGVLDAVTPEEYAKIMHNQHANESALKRKQEEGLKLLGARERVKLLKDAENQKERDTVFKIPEHHFSISTRALSMDILSIMLYARSCLLSAPYMGVYAVPVAQAKRQSSMQQTQAQQLRIPPDSTFTANSIIPDVYTPEFTSTQPLARAHGSTVLLSPFSNESASNGPSSTSSPTPIQRDPVPLHLCIGDKNQHWLPMDRAVNVVKNILHFLSNDELTAVYREMEFNTMFLMPNGTLDLPEGTHSLIRSTIRLFAMCPIDGGFDLSWHDLYHSVADLGNQNEYSAHFIKTQATKEAIVPVPDPIVVPVLGTITGERILTRIGNGSDSEGESNNDEKETEEEGVELVIQRRLLFTRDPTVSYMHKKMTMEDYKEACARCSAAPPACQSWHESDSSRKRQVNVIQEDVLGNHPYHKHYHHIHPDTLLVNMDTVLQLISEAMLKRSATVSLRIRQIFVEGDTNGDGVLSFSEFMDIVKKVAPEYHDRKILKMFREALMKGDDNECIGPEAFLEVCTAYGLVKLVDINSLSLFQLRALSDPPAFPTGSLTVVRQEIRKDRSGKFPIPGRSHKKRAGYQAVSESTDSLVVGNEQIPTLSPSLASSKSSKGSSVQNSLQHSQPKSKVQVQVSSQLATSNNTSKKHPVEQIAIGAASLKGKHRYEDNIRESIDFEMGDSDEDIIHEGQCTPPISSNNSIIPAPKLAAKIRVASMGDIIVGTVHRESVSVKFPMKGKADSMRHNNLDNNNALIESLKISASGIHGKRTPMQSRSLTSSNDLPEKSNRQTVELTDEIDSISISPNKKPKQTLQVVMPQMPSPEKNARKFVPADKLVVEQTEVKAAVADEPRLFALDSSLAEAHIAQVRGVKLNEEMSKEGAQRLLDQLRIKREERARR